MHKSSLLITILLVAVLGGCIEKESQTPSDSGTAKHSFSFAFLTDVHLNKDNNGNGNEGLEKALNDVKTHNVDFVIFGGDLTDLDGLKPEQENSADSLVARFKSIVEKSNIPAHFTIGNHDRFYTFEGQADPDGFKMFEKHLGKTYYSFDHKGVHFVVLNSVQHDAEHTYL